MPNDLRNFLIITSLFSTIILSGQVQAQVFPRGNAMALADISQFDMYVQIQNWENLRSDAGEFRLETLQQLAKELKTAGIVRRPARRDYLVCNLQATRDGNRIAYSASLQYWLMASTGAHKLLWEDSHITIVGDQDFTAERIASECAALIVDEWQRWNPGT